jgi:hypothetical protein
MGGRLEVLVRRVSSLHTGKITPVHLDFSRPQIDPLERPQLSLFGPSPNSTSMGTYFELLTQAMYGGVLRNKIQLEHPNGDPLGETQPDLINYDTKEMWEIKACRSGSHCPLRDGQMEKYLHLQRNYPEFTIHFVFYRHSLKGIEHFEQGEDALYRRLTLGIYHAVSLPLSVIMAMHDPTVRRHDALYRYGGSQKYKSCTTVRSQTLNAFLVDPEHALATFDLDHESFVIQRSFSPHRFAFEGLYVKPFPLTVMTDKYYGEWVDSLLTTQEQVATTSFDDPFADREAKPAMRVEEPEEANVPF